MKVRNRVRIQYVKNLLNNPILLSDLQLTEGKRKLAIAYRYERNPLARQLCLQHYGFNCSVCGFNFKDMYGEIGENFIHVHHLNEISSIGTEYKIDPIKDLRPVCANCHSMLHKRKPAFSIEELKSSINNA